MSKIINDKNQLMSPEDWPNVLITTGDWFYGPDGNQYNGVYGKLDIVTSEDLSFIRTFNNTIIGFDPKTMANFVYRVGESGKQIILHGCRVHYISMCKTKPLLKNNIYDTTKE